MLNQLSPYIGDGILMLCGLVGLIGGTALVKKIRSTEMGESIWQGFRKLLRRRAKVVIEAEEAEEQKALDEKNQAPK